MGNNNQETITFSIDKERKEYHDKKRKRKLVKLIIAGIIWLSLVIFLLTPFASYKMMNVTGTVYLNENQVLEMAGIKNTWWWIVDSSKVKNKLESYSNIDNVSVSLSIRGLSISILEKYPVATIKDENNNTYYIMNVNSDNKVKKQDYPLTIKDPIDISQLDSSLTRNFAIDYSRVDKEIRDYFTKLEMIDSNTVLLKGCIDSSSYFQIEMELNKIDKKLIKSQFVRIKEEILGKVSKDNVKYDSNNPVHVKYNFTNLYEFEIV